MTDPEMPLKVLSVVGAGRSGTTVLASILGEVEGFASAGELRWLWERGIALRRPCGCGKSPENCPVWAPVITRVMASSESWTAQEIVASQHEVGRQRNLPRLLSAMNNKSAAWPALDRVLSATGTACHGFAEVTNARVVVDTSKRPQDAAVLAMLAGVDHFVLHVVRDPRAVAHSWRRQKTFSTEGGGTRTMGTRRLPSSVRAWTTNSIGAELLRRRLPEPRWMHMRYEDFSRDPRSKVESILTFLGEAGEAPFQDDDTVLLHPNHIVAGNPSRFTTGAVQIRADEEWQRAMPRRDQLLVEVATKPLMMRYGYAGRTAGRAPAP